MRKIIFTNRIAQIAAVGFLLCCPGCESQDLSRSKAKSLLEARPVRIAAVIIPLSDEQIACATSAGLLQVEHDNYGVASTVPTEQGLKLGANSTLQSKGDVMYAPTDDKEFAGKRQLQLDGTFSLAVDEVTGITDSNTTQGIKRVEAEVRIKLEHGCFPKPLKAVADLHSSALRFRFRRYDDGWRLDWQER